MGHHEDQRHVTSAKNSFLFPRVLAMPHGNRVEKLQLELQHGKVQVGSLFLIQSTERSRHYLCVFRFGP